MSFASTVRAILTSRRLSAVTAQSFSSGLPLGLVTMAIPTCMTMAGVDIKTVGLLTAIQLPYTFKFLWSPLVDRFAMPLVRGKRGWILAMQLALALGTFGLAGLAFSLQVAAVAAVGLFVSLASATQDIAVDAYAVESLDKDEQGVAVGARTAVYRAAMFISGALAISVSGAIGWGWTFAIIGLLFLLLTPSALMAPPPPPSAVPPRSLREAVVEPFRGFFQKPRALEIVAFLLFYKIADNIAVSLVRPFLTQMKFSPMDIGVVTGTVGLAATLAGTFVGGALTRRLGLGRCLWIFGILQAFGDTGYAAVAHFGPVRPLLYGATILDTCTSGLGTGAFMVLLLRLTSKRFSATQYALFSSFFALGRTISGPVAGLMTSAMGWELFFLSSVLLSIPGMAMLHRFAPFGSRDLKEGIEEEGEEKAPLGLPPASASTSSTSLPPSDGAHGPSEE